MKKIFFISFISVICSTLFGISYADVPSAEYGRGTGNIYVSGTADASLSGSDAIILVSEGDNILYIGSGKINDLGEYSEKININGDYDIASLEIKVNAGGEDITHTLSAAESELMIALDGDYDRINQKMTAYIKNLYDYENEFSLIVSSYDETGRLLNVKKYDASYAYTEEEQAVTVDYTAPEKAVKYKLYAWQKSDILPISEADEDEYIDISEVSDRYTADEAMAAAAMFEGMNTDSTETRNIYNAYKNGDYEKSLILYRNYMIDILRDVEYDKDSLPQYSSFTSEYYYGTADVVVGYRDIDDLNAKYLSGTNSIYVDYENILDYIDTSEPSQLNWVVTEEQGTASFTKDNLRNLFLRLAIRYSQTGDEIYVEKLLQLMEDYALNYKNQYDEYYGISNLSYEERGKNMTKYGNEIYAYNSVGSRAASYLVSRTQKLNCFVYALVLAAKALPGETEPGYSMNYYNNGLCAPCTQEASADALKFIDPVRFARFMAHMRDVELPTLAHSVLNAPGGTMNITAEAYLNSIKLSALFGDFENDAELTDRIFAASDEFFTGVFAKDGGCVETSFNYNDLTVDQLANTAYTLKATRKFLNAKDYIDIERNYARLMEGYSSPLGLMTNIGNVYNNYGTAAVWKDSSAKQELAEKLEPQEYESIYYPYSGYGSMRNGWGIDDMYMSFFTNPNRGIGHKFVGTNAVMNVTAFGRTLLLCGGVPWYGKDYVSNYTEFLEDGYNEINGYFGENSSRKASTVMVNGKSQEDAEYSFDSQNEIIGGSSLDKNAQTKPLSGRWLTSEYFDFCEGTYDNAYTVFDTESEIQPDTDNGTTRDATHNRQFIFAKDAGVWLVVDNLTNLTSDSNMYEALWHFPAYEAGNRLLTGFSEEQVVVDNDNDCIYTNDATGPNVYLYESSTSEISFEKYCGYYEQGKTGLGWSNGSNNISTGKYAPRPQVHVKWSDDGASDVTQLVTVIAPSKNATNPVKAMLDRSDKTIDKTAYTYLLNNGSSLYFSFSPNCHSVFIDNNEIKAKGAVYTRSENGVFGILLDCERINSGRINGSFAFEVKDGVISLSDEICTPKNFEWKETENGHYPVYE